MPSVRKRIKYDIYDMNMQPLPARDLEELKQEEPASAVILPSAAAGRRTPNIIGNKEAVFGAGSAFLSTSSLKDPNQQSQYPYG